MIRTLADIQEYFRRLATISPDIQEFVVGDSEQILSLDRSKMDYPVLWLETPTIRWDFDRVGSREYDFHIVILSNSPIDTWAYQQYILNQTAEITHWLLAKLKSDHADEVLQLSFSASSQPIVGYGHDHDYGWRTRLTIQAPMLSCADCHFPEVCPIGSIASFTWSNNVDGDFSNLVLTDTSIYTNEPGWAIAWNYQIDNGTVVTGSDVPGPDLGAGTYIKVWLIITNKDCTLTASAVFRNAVACGDSVPYMVENNFC
jgi:hypothetical protein